MLKQNISKFARAEFCLLMQDNQMLKLYALNVSSLDVKIENLETQYYKHSTQNK